MYAEMLVTSAIAIAATMASAAPALIPRIPGSASGLRVSPCMSAPASPSAAPTSRPMSVRGTRRSVTIASFAVSPPCSSASMTSCRGIEREPSTRLATQTTASTTTASTSPPTRAPVTGSTDAPGGGSCGRTAAT